MASKKVIIDICQDSWKTAASKVAEAIKSHSEKLSNTLKTIIVGVIVIITTMVGKLKPASLSENDTHFKDSGISPEMIKKYRLDKVPYLPIVKYENCKC